jgi:hypothetical protein
MIAPPVGEVPPRTGFEAGAREFPPQPALRDKASR